MRYRLTDGGGRVAADAFGSRAVLVLPAGRYRLWWRA
jgi:hypothetical protein